MQELTIWEFGIQQAGDGLRDFRRGLKRVKHS